MKTLSLILVGCLFVACGTEEDIGTNQEALNQARPDLLGVGYVVHPRHNPMAAPDCAGAPFAPNVGLTEDMFSLHTKKTNGKVLIPSIKKVGDASVCIDLDFATYQGNAMLKINLDGQTIVAFGKCMGVGEHSPGALLAACTAVTADGRTVVTTNGVFNMGNPALPGSDCIWTIRQH